MKYIALLAAVFAIAGATTAHAASQDGIQCRTATLANSWGESRLVVEQRQWCWDSTGTQVSHASAVFAGGIGCSFRHRYSQVDGGENDGKGWSDIETGAFFNCRTAPKHMQDWQIWRCYMNMVTPCEVVGIGEFVRS